MTKFIDDEVEYSKITAEALKLISFDLTFPQFMFRRNYKNYVFGQDAIAFDFGTIETLCDHFGDSDVSLYCIAPDGPEFWLQSGGHFGAFRFNLAGGELDWNDALDRCLPKTANTLRLAGSKFVIWGNTNSWCTFSDIRFEAAVIGCDMESVEILKRKFHYLNDIGWLIDYWNDLGVPLEVEYLDKLYYLFGPTSN